MSDARYLFDTNILIYLLGGVTELLRDRVEQLAPGQAITSAICVAEVSVGTRQADKATRGKIERLYRLIEPIPFDRHAAQQFGTLPYRRGESDRLIAAHALSLGLTLVTANERDFADIPGLAVENWTR